MKKIYGGFMLLVCFGMANGQQFTPIGQAIKNADVAEVKNLIGSGKAKVSDSAQVGVAYPLLSYALITYSYWHKDKKDAEKSKNLAEIIDYLLAQQAPVDAVITTSDATPLHFAVTYQLTPFVTKLIQKGANLNMVDRNNWTPLFLAVRFKNPDIVKHLLQNNADTSIRDKRDNLTAYEFAKKHQLHNIVKVFDDLGKK